MVRFMAEGKDGREVRNRIVQAMWVDVELRAKKLGVSFMTSSILCGLQN